MSDQAVATLPALGFLGGTGPHGRGLAARLALAGHPVLVGSREPSRAARVARELAERAGGADLRGVGNEQACEQADIVFVTVPYEAQRATLAPLAARIGGKIVVGCVNAVAFDDLGPRPLAVAAGSATEEAQELLPSARVVAAFHTVSAVRLRRLDAPVNSDVLVCGDDAEAKDAVIAVAERIPGARGVDAGPLRLSSCVENLTAVLLAVNRRYRTHAGVRLER